MSIEAEYPNQWLEHMKKYIASLLARYCEAADDPSNYQPISTLESLVRDSKDREAVYRLKASGVIYVDQRGKSCILSNSFTDILEPPVGQDEW